MAIQVGDTIGDYQVVGLLGKGGMGRVYRVRSLLTEREEAMKVVATEVADNPELAERFLHEIKLHARLKHPHIASLLSAQRVGGLIVMILELVDGVSLDTLVRGGPIEPRLAARYVGEVLSALAYAHSMGIVHRDIKPANILLTRQGSVKLTDFGISRAVTDQHLTGAGMAVGSLWYMSPEQIRSAPVDARSDVYSLGISFYEMLTGRRPIQGDSEYAIMHAQLQQMPAPPAAVIAGLPVGLSEIVMKALAKDPAMRYQSAAEFQAALTSMGGPIPETIAMPAPAPTASSLTPAEIDRIARRLSASLGPIARRVAEDAARRFPTPAEVIAYLAEQIPEPADRAKFLATAGADSSIARPPVTNSAPSQPGTLPAAPSAASWEPALLDRLARQLAAYVGPLARIIVKKTARTASDERSLIAALAAEIASEPDRRKFLAEATNPRAF
jgi:serine/threonine-protein kinase